MKTINTQDYLAHMDEFTQGFIEAAIFTECHAGRPELEHADSNDISAESIVRIAYDCAAWQVANTELLEEAYTRNYDETQAGRDYWLTRNGHGAGFWSRDELTKHDDLGDKLTNAAGLSEVTVYLGDDGQLHFANV